MQTQTHNQHRPAMTLQTAAPLRLAARLKRALAHCWLILRAVLRGYCAGQPCRDGRPRKGCC